MFLAVLWGRKTMPGLTPWQRRQAREGDGKPSPFPQPTVRLPGFVTACGMLDGKVPLVATDGCSLVNPTSVCCHGHQSIPAAYGLVRDK